jgi:hypothetical protein
MPMLADGKGGVGAGQIQLRHPQHGFLPIYVLVQPQYIVPVHENVFVLSTRTPLSIHSWIGMHVDWICIQQK